MEIILSSIIAFASTNIDDIFVLMLFFGNSRYKPKDVVIGQYLGISGLILISLIGSLIGLFLSKPYIGLLGFIPIFLGVRSLITVINNGNNKNEGSIKGKKHNKQGHIFSVAGITFANGGDNIGIYIPLFATLNMAGKVTMILIFLGMVALWCWIGKYLSKHPVIASAISKYGHIVTPIVLILLGIYILYESGSFSFIYLL